MVKPTRNSVAFFSKPFKLPGFDSIQPAGAYKINSSLSRQQYRENPKPWTVSIHVRLRPKFPNRGQQFSFVVALTNCADVRAKNMLSGNELANLFFDRIQADPAVKLLMDYNESSGLQLQHLILGAPKHVAVSCVIDPIHQIRANLDNFPIQVAENEGMPSLTN
ncbi:hypothetical protein MXMO3_03432 (plasmid) [Maritalea myrionectae]|uniref:Uncharacterized protein n=1 Tax=Maritalea myrionectae TaxID=454601 RepID=A0A2R4MIU7_9HYPH|nr:hypothetical protein [Maritalea myrionectae]AVX05935.1 hypothetical protein MXMO3_03432 [Maritalea myrionectae]